MTALLVPLLLAAVAVCGVVRRVDVYAALADGARSGGKILLSVFPNLVALLTAVAMLRASGAFEALAEALGPVLGRLGIPAETLPLMLVRPFSGSAALGVGAELIQNYGPDSPVGRTAAVMLGGTETTFYTVAVYFGAAGVRRSRYALPAALTADFVGFLAAALAVRLFSEKAPSLREGGCMRGAYSMPIRSFSTAPASTSPAAPGTKGLLEGI